MGFRHNFLIDLGGTGGAALEAFRAETVEHAGEYQNLLQQGRRFEYLYLDSNAVDVACATPWEHHGQHIGLVLGTRSLLLSLPEIVTVEEIFKLPQVEPWIGENGVASIEKMFASPALGASQMRRYGRVLAAIHADEIKERLCTGICSLASGSTDYRKVTFHVFASLGGGTGSGCLVDVLTLLPQLCRDFNIKRKIVVYLFVGGADVCCSDEGFFFKNEYAALRDINALMSNRYRPFRALEPRMGKEPFHDTADPIDSVYISTEEDGVSDLGSQVKRFASSCFEWISYLPDSTCSAGRAFTGEFVYGSHPGEVSEVVEDPHTRARVVEQSLPRNDGRQFVSTVDRSYRFQTLSGVLARHPKEELHGILTAELGKKVLERWIFGDVRNRGSRDTTAKNNTDIFPIGLDTDAIASIVGTLDNGYRSEKLGEFDCFVKRLKDEDYKPTTLQSIQKITEKIRASIFEDTVLHVKPNSNGVETDVELTCRTQAQDVHDQIIEQLERRRVWQQTGHTFGTTWGIADMVTYLESLKNALRQQGTYGTPDFPKGLDNMKARSREWNKLGPLSFKTTPKPSSMFEYQVAEGRALIEEACDIRKELIRRVRNRMLIEMLEKDIELYKEAILELDNSQKERMENLQIACRNRLGNLAQDVANSELHDGDDRVLVWNEEYLYKHEAFYEDDAKCADSVANAMYDCEVRFRNIVGPARNLVEKAGELITDILSTGGVLWTASDAIHEELCNRVSTRQYPRAYAQTIYHYLAEKGAPFRDALTNLLWYKIAPSAAVAVLGDPTCGEIQPGPWQASCLGMSDAAMLSGAAADAHKDMRNRLLIVLRRKASRDVCLEAYGHRDPFEIRLCYTQYLMPLRFFRVMDVLEKSYKRGLESGNPEALFFPNIDDAGMLDPSPDRPDLLPELDPIKHTAREELRKQLQEKNTH